jgi:hypothetical protein
MTRPTDMHSGLSHEAIKAVLDYDERAGRFSWKAKRNQVVGEAGSINPQTGYRIIKIFGRKVMAHRLAWFWMTGEWPIDRLDHRDGDNANNRFANLRPASDRQNATNTKTRADNKIGIKGVRLLANGRYQARIWDGGKNIHLGLFDSVSAAKAAYDIAARRMFGEFARTA